MSLTTTTVASLIAILVCAAAIYNAYLLRGGKMALSQVFTAFGMVILVFSLIADRLGGDFSVLDVVTVSDLLFMAGFLFLLLSSMRILSTLKK